MPDPFSSEVEARAGIMLPVEYFAVIESALRHAEGLGVEEHRDRIAALYSEFSRVAARNPHAWSREEVPAAAIRNASASNPMIAFPYTKRVSSQWNVNQAAAVLVCSVAKARALGLDESRWIYPLAATQNRHVVVLARKRQLHTHPGTVIAGERACALAGIRPSDVSMAELDSCHGYSMTELRWIPTSLPIRLQLRGSAAEQWDRSISASIRSPQRPEELTSGRYC